MVIVAQLVRAPLCESGGRGCEPRRSPKCGLFTFSKAISLVNIILVPPIILKEGSESIIKAKINLQKIKGLGK